MDPYYCKIFIDFPADREVLMELIRSMTEGENRRWTIVAKVAEIDVEENDDYVPLEQRTAEHDFIFYRYYLDVEPVPPLEEERDISFVRTLVRGLRAAGAAVVPACDFEDQLNEA
jgi:hypothetical protein